MVRSRVRTVSPIQFDCKQGERRFGHPLQLAPMLRRNVCLHITDHLRATVPSLA